MPVLAKILFFCFLSKALSHSHGVFSCSSPAHRSLPSGLDTAVRASVQGQSIVITSPTKFRGFLFTAGDGLLFTDAPEGSEITDICYRSPGRALSHTSAKERDQLVIGFSCTPGATVSMSGYVVFKYSIPFVSVGGSFSCPSVEATTTTTTVVPSESLASTAP